MRKKQKEFSKTKRRMTKEEIEKKKKIITKVFISILIIVVFMVIAYNLNNFIVLDNNKTKNLIINNKNITSNLKNEILEEDNIIYLSKQDIANFFDKYIYEDKETNQIITTYEKKIAAIGFEKNMININGSDKKIYAHAIEREGKVYLPISEMKDVYDIEIDNIEASKVITMDSTSREQKKAIVTSNIPVKASTNFIARTVDRIKKGDYVIVISSDDKGVSRVRTSKGKIGYIKTKKLVNEVVVRENLEQESQIKGKVNLVWDYFYSTASIPNREGSNIEGINVVSPSFFHINKNGEFEEKIGQAGKDYIKWAHSKGYKVWPMVSNDEASSSSLLITSKVMNSYQKRQELIENIVNACVKYDLDGINLDFENMKEEDKDMYSRFVIELTPRLKEIGLVISVDVTAPDGGETWSMCFDRHTIGNVADYIVFMAYDEYGVSSTKTGTTAGYDWVKLNLNKFLQTEEIDSDKIILAVPLYTRVWTTDNNGKVTSKTVAMKNIQNVIPEGAKKDWDDQLKQNYVEYQESSNKKQIWIEDIDSLKAKMSLITENNLAGIGAWQKDMESDEVWHTIKEMLQND